MLPVVKGGMANSVFYNSREWRELRFRVIVKYGRKCMCCNATDKPIHVDHIKPISKYPKLKLSENNLQILCEDCNLGKSNLYETDFRPDKPASAEIEKILKPKRAKEIKYENAKLVEPFDKNLMFRKVGFSQRAKTPHGTYGMEEELCANLTHTTQLDLKFTIGLSKIPLKTFAQLVSAL